MNASAANWRLYVIEVQRPILIEEVFRVDEFSSGFVLYLQISMSLDVEQADLCRPRCQLAGLLIWLDSLSNSIFICSDSKGRSGGISTCSNCWTSLLDVLTRRTKSIDCATVL